jgi:pilus assembly protein Flp/PilA
MSKLFNLLKLFQRKEGQGMVEYALIIALVAVFLVAGLTAMRGQIVSVFDSIRTALGGAAG